MKRLINICLYLLIAFTCTTGCTKVKDIPDKSITESDMYKQAIEYIKENRYPQAMGILKSIPDYKDTKNLLSQLRYLINGSYISNGIWAVGAITAEGGVQVAYKGKDANRFESTKTWKDVVAICSRGGDSIEGLTKEGKIITTSTETKENLLSSTNASENAMANVVESVLNWNNIKSFQTFYPQTAVALSNDGSVFAAYPGYQDGTARLQEWKDIVSVADGRSYVVGIKADGTVISNNYGYSGTIDTSKWRDIVAIAADFSVIGLREDGTVVSTGLNENGEGNVSDWVDIIAISTSRFCTLGLKSDGTVVATGTNTFGQMNVHEWKDIVAISAGYYFSIGLKADGTILIAGDCSASGVETPDTSGMKGLYVPHISFEE